MEALGDAAVRDAQEKAHKRATERLVDVPGGLQLQSFI